MGTSTLKHKFTLRLCAFAVELYILLSIVFAITRKTAKLQDQQSMRSITFPTGSLSQPVLTVLVSLSILCGLCLLVSGCGSHKPDNQEAKTDDVQPLVKHWEKSIPHQTPPEGLRSLSAEECGECHQEIYKEWKESFHAQAWHDPQFQAEWAKDDSIWVCLNCHAPLQNQQEFVVLGKKDGDYFQPVKQPNPKFDPALREEGITCAVCHVRDGAVIGPFGNQRGAPHAVRKDPGHLSREICLSCHNVEDAISPTLVCTFQTGEEWKSSPYAQEGEDCISCHMPAVERALVDDGPIRSVRKHTWVGSGIPKFGDENRPQDGYVPGLDVQIVPHRQKDPSGDMISFTVLLTNQRAGHFLPTGDPEYFITLNLRLLDARGNTLQDTTYRIGQEWQWWPEAKKLSDNRLRPLEKRTYSFSFTIPQDAPELSFKVEIKNHRMTEENARAMGLIDFYPLSVTVFEKTISLSESY